MKKISFVPSILFTLVILISGFVIFPAGNKKESKAKEVLTGEQLARIYCATCHIFPEASLLDKATWKERVLPNMGWRLGIRRAGDNPYENIEKDEVALVRALNIFPTKQLILPENWKKITEYYLQAAPPKPLPQKTPPSFDSSLRQFHAQSISFPGRQVPKTSMLKYDSASALLYIGDAQNELFILRSNLKLLASVKVQSPPVDLCFNSGYPRVLCIGSISPSEKKQGSFYSLDSSGSVYSRFDNLGRPVSVEEADLNGDEKKTYLFASSVIIQVNSVGLMLVIRKKNIY